MLTKYLAPRLSKFVQHEILNAHKYKINLVSDKPRMLFFPLINFKMPTIVGILTFMSRKNFQLYANGLGKSCIQRVQTPKNSMKFLQNVCCLAIRGLTSGFLLLQYFRCL